MPLGFFAKHLSLARILPLTRFMATKPTQAWTSVAATSETPAHSIYSVPFEKSQLDDREYRVVRLSNNLEALLISDKNADKAAASLDVDVGHLSDPVSVLLGKPQLDTQTRSLRSTSPDAHTSASISCSW